MSLTRILILSLALIGAFTQVSCKREQSAKHETAISALLPLSGDLAFLGEPGRYALEIAKEKFESEGTPVRFEIHDTKADPKEAVTLIRREHDINRRNIFLVTLSGPSLAAREALEGSDSLLLSIAIHPDLPSTTAPIIRFCPSAAQEARMLVDKLITTTDSVALVVSRDAATTYQVNNLIVPALNAANKSLAFVEWFDVGNKDFKNLAAKLASKPTQEIVLLGYGSDFPAALEAIRQARGSAPTRIYGGIGFVELAEKPDGMDQMEVNAVVPAFCVDETLQGAAEFKAAYMARTGKPAPYDAAYTYDAAIAVGTLVESGSTTASEILHKLRGSTITGVTGKIMIGTDGETTTDLRWATLFQSGLKSTR